MPESAIMGKDEVLIVATCCIRRLQGTAHSHGIPAYIRSDEHFLLPPRMQRRLCYGRAYREDDSTVSRSCLRSPLAIPHARRRIYPNRSLTPPFSRVLREFASSTILTIAHRLRTVIDYDRVRLPVSVRTSPSERNL